MATTKKWIVNVAKKPNYCGVGAGGAQFANGKAVITNKHLADWFKSHDGYTVQECKGSKEETEA